MALQIKKAQRSASKARIALVGVSGAGKTMTALQMANALVPGGRFLVIDTEHGSSQKYAGEVVNGAALEFDVIELDFYAPATYVEAIELGYMDYDVVIIDSLSHAWAGKGGALEQVDNAGASGNKFGAWRNVTPQHNRLVESILGCPAHVIATMRAKAEYVQEKNERTGKTTVTKVGLAPVQRDGVEYEFDVVLDVDINHRLHVSKTRCRAINGRVWDAPTEGHKLGAEVREWLLGGALPDWLPVPDLESAETESLRQLLDDMKQQQPEHPRKRDVVNELRTRANAAKGLFPADEIPQSVSPDQAAANGARTTA